MLGCDGSILRQRSSEIFIEFSDHQQREQQATGQMAFVFGSVTWGNVSGLPRILTEMGNEIWLSNYCQCHYKCP